MSVNGDDVLVFQGSVHGFHINCVHRCEMPKLGVISGFKS